MAFVIDGVNKAWVSARKGVDFEQEQLQAIKAAHNLIIEHNQSMLEDDKEDREEAVIAEEFPCPWRRIVATAIADLFFCEFYYTQVKGKQKYTFNFVGLESNGLAAMALTKYLIADIIKESNAQQKANNAPSLYGTNHRNTSAKRITELCAVLKTDSILNDAGASSSQPSTSASPSGERPLVSLLYSQEHHLNTMFMEKVLGVTTKQKKVGGQFKSNMGTTQAADPKKTVSVPVNTNPVVTRNIGLTGDED